MFAMTFREQWVVQAWLPAVKDGDKRIILVDGEYAGAVNRVPARGRPALQHGARRLAEGNGADAARARNLPRLGPHLRERGLLLVGIDVIGDYLTEINVTSPTGIRAVSNVGGPDIAKLVWDKIEGKRRRLISPRSRFSSRAALARNAERVRPRRSAASSIAFSSPASSDRFAFTGRAASSTSGT